VPENNDPFTDNEQKPNLNKFEETLGFRRILSIRLKKKLPEINKN